MSENKAREYFLALNNQDDLIGFSSANSVKIDEVFSSKSPAGVERKIIQVVEKEAYNKAVSALETISQYKSAYSGESSPEANIARATLKELGHD